MLSPYRSGPIGTYMRALILLPFLAAITVASAAEQEFPEQAFYDAWSVFSDGEVCWISSFSLDPNRGEGSPRAFLTYYDHVPKGELAIFDEAQYAKSDLIAMVVDGRAYQLDKDPSDPRYAYDNTPGLISALQNSTAMTFSVVFKDDLLDRQTYTFSLEGMNQAAQKARDHCDAGI